MHVCTVLRGSYENLHPVKPHDILFFGCDNNIVSTKIYDKRDDCYFDIVNFPFLVAMSLNVILMVCI